MPCFSRMSGRENLVSFSPINTLPNMFQTMATKRPHNNM